MLPTPVFLGFPGGSDGKESTCNVGDLGSTPGPGRSPEGGHGNPRQYSCLESPHGQRSLAGYGPRGCKESDMTEQLSPHTRVQFREFPGDPGVRTLCLQCRGHRFHPWLGN